MQLGEPQFFISESKQLFQKQIIARIGRIAKKTIVYEGPFKDAIWVNHPAFAIEFIVCPYSFENFSICLSEFARPVSHPIEQPAFVNVSSSVRIYAFLHLIVGPYSDKGIPLSESSGAFAI